MPPRPLATPFIGAALRYVRECAGLNLTSLAELLEQQGHEVHPSTLGKIEAGKHKPSPELLRALTIALKVDVRAFAVLPDSAVAS